MKEDRYYELKSEVRDILLCFLKDTELGMPDSSEQIADERVVKYNKKALSDAMGAIMPMIVKK